MAFLPLLTVDLPANRYRNLVQDHVDAVTAGILSGASPAVADARAREACRLFSDALTASAAAASRTDELTAARAEAVYLVAALRPQPAPSPA